MSGYLEGYGVGEEKRERRLKRAALAAGLVLVAAGGFYFFFRNYRETRRAEQFFDLLRRRDYAGAYALWGCTESSPCRDYSMQKFLEDWGPASDHADLSRLQITHVRGCSSGVIVEANFGGGLIEFLWVDRKTRNLGFAPFPVCNPVYRPGAAKPAAP
jgi:hypothetical protein